MRIVFTIPELEELGDIVDHGEDGGGRDQRLFPPNVAQGMDDGEIPGEGKIP